MGGYCTRNIHVYSVLFRNTSGLVAWSLNGIALCDFYRRAAEGPTDEMSESHCSSATEHSMRIDLKVWQETKFAGFVVCKISRC